jgi:hypothetical protein
VIHQNQKIVEFYCRHLVGLFVTYRDKDEVGLQSRFAACSGTLIVVENALYLLTAGHVLKELHRLRTCEKIDIEDAHLADVFGVKRICEWPIPFDLKNAHLLFIDDDDLGLDFGIIPLSSHYARLLLRNNVIALTEANWIRQDGIKPDTYAVLGFPEEFSSERISKSGNVSVGPTIVLAQSAEDEADNEILKSKFARFVGKVSDTLPLGSLRGMSGGLIIGIQHEPVSRYWTVALQSSWDPQKRRIYGCKLSVIGSLLTAWSRDQVPILKPLNENTFVITPEASVARMERSEIRG